MASNDLHLLRNICIQALKEVLILHVDCIIVISAQVIIVLALRVGIGGWFLSGGLALLLEIMFAVHVLNVLVDLLVAELTEPEEVLQGGVDVFAIDEELGTCRTEDLPAGPAVVSPPNHEEEGFVTAVAALLVFVIDPLVSRTELAFERAPCSLFHHQKSYYI